MTDHEHDPMWNPDAPADPDLARVAATLAPLRHRAPLRELPPRRRRSRAPWIGGAAVILAAAAVLVFWWSRRSDAPCGPGEAGFRFEALSGVPTCGGTARHRGVLPAGGTLLETGDGEAVRVEVADIGTIDLAPRSKLSLVETGPDQHRLDLRHGSLHARVNAPPRLFVIDTPAATAIDLGCEYDLEVDRDGAGFLRVTSGKVELATGETVRLVVEGSTARIHPGRGPGTPSMNTSSPLLRAAIDRFDGGDLTAVDAILAHASRTDTLTLWHLLARRDLDADARGRLYNGIRTAISIPPWIERDLLIAGDPQKLEQLREYLEPYWFYPEVLDQR